MKKIWIVVGIVAVVSAFCTLISGCDNKCPGCDSSPCECEDPQITIVEETDTAPKQVNVVIDKSASMKGYFNKADMRPILQVINDLQHAGTKEGTVALLGDKPMQDHATTLKNASGFSSDTDMKAIFRQLIKDGDSMPVAFITDGIFSTANGLLDAPQMVARIKSFLKDKSNHLGVALYRFTTPYDGVYYIEKTRTSGYKDVTLKAENRPFYVIVIGPKGQIRHINNNQPFKGEFESLFYNVHDDHENLVMYPLDKSVFSGPKDGNYFLVNDGQDKYELAFKFPACLRGVIANLAKSNASLKLNGEALKGWNVALQGGGENVAVLTMKNKNGEFDTDLNEDNELVLEFKTNDEGIWEEYFSEDDSKILTDVSEQSKTFGLKYLVEAVQDSESNDEVEVVFKFKN